MDQTEYLSYATLFKETLSLAATISVDVLIGIQTRNGRRIWCASEEGLKHELMSKSIKIGVDDVLFQIEHEVTQQQQQQLQQQQQQQQQPVAAVQLPPGHQAIPAPHHHQILQPQQHLIQHHHPHLPPPPYQQQQPQQQPQPHHPAVSSPVVQNQVTQQILQSEKDNHRVKSLKEEGRNGDGGNDLLENFEMEPMQIKTEGGGGGAAASNSSSSSTSTATTTIATTNAENGILETGQQPSSSCQDNNSGALVKTVEYIQGSDPEKPFLCKTCEKPFTSAAHLSIHTRVHTGERSFHCTKCPKSFGKSMYDFRELYFPPKVSLVLI